MAKLVVGQKYLSKSEMGYRTVIGIVGKIVAYEQDVTPGEYAKCTVGNFQFRYPTLLTEEKQKEIDAIISSIRVGRKH